MTSSSWSFFYSIFTKMSTFEVDLVQAKVITDQI